MIDEGAGVQLHLFLVFSTCWSWY